MKNKSVYSNNRNVEMPYGKNIFKDKPLEFNKKYRKDGLKLLDQIKDDCIPVVFFDPQYRGILDKMNYGNEGARQIKRSQLHQMSEETIIDFLVEINRVLIPKGHLFLWIDKFHLCEGIGSWLKKVDLAIVDMIVWDKERMGMGYRTRKQSEYLLVLQKPPLRAKDVWKSRNIRDIWTEKISNKKHPHQKPVELQKILIESVSNIGDVILDPAAGSFSVMESANLLDRLFLGTDLKVKEDK
ncbi:MAG: DNA-methyltransferase [Mycoplasmoidaceae bacterium]